MSSAKAHDSKKPAKSAGGDPFTQVIDPDALLKLASVECMLGSRSSKVYEDIIDGLVPAPIRRSQRDAVWPAREIQIVARAVAAGLTRDQRRELVKKLMNERAAMAQEILTMI